MLGAYLGAEMNNFGCPWGGTYTEEQLDASRVENEAEVGPAHRAGARYEDIVFSVAVGNEATVDWTDHFVPVPRMIEHVRRVKAAVRQPVTFCENYVPWQHKLRDWCRARLHLAAHLPGVGVQAHPRGAGLHQGQRGQRGAPVPGKPVVITEAGWCTNSNGRGMHAEHAVQELQAIYYQDLMDWTRAAGLLCFVFEAFDEPWKGSADPLEPEKHWGLFTVDRRPKLVMQRCTPSGCRRRPPPDPRMNPRHHAHPPHARRGALGPLPRTARAVDPRGHAGGPAHGLAHLVFEGLMFTAYGAHARDGSGTGWCWASPSSASLVATLIGVPSTPRWRPPTACGAVRARPAWPTCARWRRPATCQPRPLGGQGHALRLRRHVAAGAARSPARLTATDTPAPAPHTEER
jgi:hypothetical protein